MRTTREGEYASLRNTSFFRFQGSARLKSPFAEALPDIVVEALRMAEAKPEELLVNLGFEVDHVAAP